jgi:DNA (cytosine-5)-methyltransferase 1
MFTLTKANHHAVAQPVAFSSIDDGRDATEGLSPTLRVGGNSGGMMGVQASMAVRRLTPTECERLQGFPDGYTNIKTNCPDGPRYKALGNSMAVPVMKWIGQRIADYEKNVEGKQ